MQLGRFVSEDTIDPAVDQTLHFLVGVGEKGIDLHTASVCLGNHRRVGGGVARLQYPAFERLRAPNVISLWLDGEIADGQARVHPPHQRQRHPRRLLDRGALGIVAHWLLSSRAVFTGRVAATGIARTRQKALFVVSALAGLALTTGIVALSQASGLDPRAGKLVAIVASFTLTWWLRNRLVFRVIP